MMPMRTGGSVLREQTPVWLLVMNIIKCWFWVSFVKSVPSELEVGLGICIIPGMCACASATN